MLLFAAMVWTTTRSLTPAPEWSVFDARVFGYDLDYAQGYIAALRDTGGIDVYLGRQRMLDTVFPALLTAVLLVVFRARWRWSIWGPIIWKTHGLQVCCARALRR